MNNQQIYKIVNFFRINHQFHDPYQFILDGNFLKLVLEKQLDLHRKLENAIDGRITLRVTSCVLRELDLLGPTFRLVLD
jgi:rRNA-processing protein FCF1